MKLTSIHFATLLPIPGTSRRESALHASEGWDLERTDDGRITCRRVETVDGGTATRRFVVEGWPCVWEPDEVAEAVALLEVQAAMEGLAPAPSEPAPEPPTGKRRRK